MKWFKFYGQDYLTDPKVLALNACQRSCWITLLSYASVNDNGMITYMTEEQLMLQAGVSHMHEEWNYTKGVLDRFKELDMISIDNGVIIVKNWQKRQETNLTSYERLRRFRQKKRDDNAMITQVKRNDNARIDKNRIEESNIYMGEQIMSFEKFWSIYPKKKDKKNAERKWKKLKDEERKAILDDIPKRILSKDWKKEDGQFIPYPSTYINGRRWEDEIGENYKERKVDNFSTK